MESEAGQVAEVGRFLQLADRYSHLQEPGAATVNELIEKIVIHSEKGVDLRGGHDKAIKDISALAVHNIPHCKIPAVRYIDDRSHDFDYFLQLQPLRLNFILHPIQGE